MLIVLMLVIGALVGFFWTSRYYHVGPFADIQGTPSSANFNIGRSWAIKSQTGGSWSIKPTTSGSASAVSSDVIVTTFWIPATDTCSVYNAKVTGQTMTNPDTRTLYQECSL